MLALTFVGTQQVHAEPRFVEQSYRVESANAFGRRDWVRADLTGDGVPELVADATVASLRNGDYLALIALDASGDGGVRRATSIVNFLAGERTHLLGHILAWRASGGDRIVAIERTGTVTIHAGFPLREERRFDCLMPVTSAAIGDIDGDGADELVTSFVGSLDIYSLASGQWLRSHPVEGVTDIALAQLDADPALEIIFGGVSPGQVLDGATFATEWQYVDGFGTSIVTGRLGGQGKPRWTGSALGRFSVFQADPWSPLWSGVGDFKHIAAIEDSGGHDLLSAVDSRNTIHLYDSTTRQLLFRIPEQMPGLVVNATAGFDIDGDGLSEIAIGAGRASSSVEVGMITFSDTIDGTARWQWLPARGPYASAAWGDVDGDGHDELVTAARLVSSAPGGNLEIFDADSDQSKWRSPMDPYTADFLQLSVNRVQLRRRAGGLGRDIVLAGQTGSEASSRLIVLDGMTRTVSLELSGKAGESFVDLALLANTGATLDDFGLAVRRSTPYASVLQRRSGTDGALLWESQSMHGYIHQVLYVPPTQASAGELIAVMDDALHAYDAITGDPRWSLPTSSNVGAAHIPRGASGAEFVIYSRYGQIAFYDASTQVLLREFQRSDLVEVVTTPDGDVRRSIAATGGRLILFDGISGQTLAQSAPIAGFPFRGGHIASRRLSQDVWQLASGTGVALYRHRLELTDAMLADGFDTH